ncbi:hypothetical protein BS78_01G441000 [Paspalum vaginatum]|nr:hypothetical protein BS78_01G441000 [Paspalum vaginatum]
MLRLEEMTSSNYCAAASGSSGGSRGECAICLQDFHAEDLDKIRVMPMPCSHAFHEKCIFEWLGRNGVCPLCRLPLPIIEKEEELKVEEEEEEEVDDEQWERSRQLDIWLNSRGIVVNIRPSRRA